MSNTRLVTMKIRFPGDLAYNKEFVKEIEYKIQAYLNGYTAITVEEVKIHE